MKLSTISGDVISLPFKVACGRIADVGQDCAEQEAVALLPPETFLRYTFWRSEA
jgi:hypothetical protein